MNVHLNQYQKLLNLNLKKVDFLFLQFVIFKIYFP